MSLETRSAEPILPVRSQATVARAIARREVAFWSTVALAPAALGGLLAVRSRRAGIVAGSLTALALGGLRWQLQRWFSDEPAFEVERQIGRLSIRRYAARVEARTHVGTDDFELALERGFHRLAGYLFGGNRPRARSPRTLPVGTAGDEELRPATPVVVSAAGLTSERLPMTSPVFIESRAGGYDMAFAMPRHRTFESLPAPDDAGVHLREVSPRRVAVLGFRSGYTREIITARQSELMQLVAAGGLSAVGSPAFAAFDPPWTLPWLRRNEVFVEIR
jgi:SOUL heme-binding protein